MFCQKTWGYNMPPFLHNDCLSEWPLTVTFPHMARLLSLAVWLLNALQTHSVLINPSPRCQVSIHSNQRERYCPLWQSNMVDIVTGQKLWVLARRLLRSSDFIKARFQWRHKRRNKVSKKCLRGVIGNRSLHGPDSPPPRLLFFNPLVAVADFSFSLCLEVMAAEAHIFAWDRESQEEWEKEGGEKEGVNRWMSDQVLCMSDTLTADRLAL